MLCLLLTQHLASDLNALQQWKLRCSVWAADPGCWVSANQRLGLPRRSGLLLEALNHWGLRSEPCCSSLCSQATRT